MAIASRLVWLSVHVAVCTTGASAGQWTILHNVDFPHRLVGSPGVAPGTAYLKAPNASVCALHCLAMKDCAAIAWNAGSDHDCNFKCDDIPYPGPHTGQQAIVVRKGGRFCPAKPPPLPPPCPAGQTCWHRWSAAHPPKDAAPSPFKPSTALSHIEYSDTVAIPAGVGGDTWYVSQINATHLFASWTDGGLTSQGGHDKGVYYRAAGFPTPSEAQAERGGNSSSQKWCTDEPSHSGNTPAAANCKQMPWRGYSTGFGVVQFSSNSPKNGGLDPTIVLGNLGTVQADAVPYEGRYPAGVLSYKGTLFYGTYALAVPANPGDNKMDGCGNWCVQGPWFGMRTSTDGGISFNEPRTTPKSLSDNIFGEALQFTGATPYPFDNGTYGWVGKIKFGAPQVVDMGIDLEHSPDGKFYLLGHGAEHSDEPQAWMQGSSVYMARCNPTVADVNDKSKWEFYSGTSGHEGEASWSRGDVGAATPLFVWPNRTGVATMSYMAPLKKWMMVIGTPQHGNSMVGSFDTYFVESDSLTGPFRMVSYWQAFGPQAYFVGLPTAFAAEGTSVDANGTEALEVTLSYSANFHPAGPNNPPGRTGGWNLRKSRLVVAAAETTVAVSAPAM